jgi:hypothetical protein
MFMMPCSSFSYSNTRGVTEYALRAITSLYIVHVPLIWNSEAEEARDPEARDPTLHTVSRVFPL